MSRENAALQVCMYVKGARVGDFGLELEATITHLCAKQGVAEVKIHFVKPNQQATACAT